MTTISSPTGTIAKINPHGAELLSLCHAEHEYIWEGDPRYWEKRSPVLFPIIGTLKQNQYLFDGEIYHLPRHGFARDKQFTVTDQREDSATFSLLSDHETLRIYPFRFELRLIYSLEDSLLTLFYEVVNHDEKVMPFSIGAHPAFALPGDFSQYSIQFQHGAPPSYSLLENGLVSDRHTALHSKDGIVPLTPWLFKNDALIFKDIDSRSVVIERNDQPYIEIEYPGFPHLGIWTKPGAPFLCIEPWTGYADTVLATGNILEKESISLLAPGETFKTSFGIQVF